MPKGVKVYYRIFYVLQGGNYFFTKSIGLYSFYKTDNINIVERESIKNPQREIGDIEHIGAPSTQEQPTKVKRYLNFFKRTIDTFYRQIEFAEFKHFRDSIIGKTKDTLFVVDESNVIIKPFIAKPSWRPSAYIFTNEATNSVKIHLPSPKLHRYRIVFFEENGNQLFEIKPKEDNLTLDNTNFIHGGWFSFDLYEDDKLKEHNRFQILIPF